VGALEDKPNMLEEEQALRREIAGILPRLSRFARMLARSRSEADDLTQLTCERALTRAAQWNPSTRLDSWMFRIMQTVWYNEVRSRKVRDRHAQQEQATQEVADSGAEAAEARVLLQRVRREIAQLPEEQRVVMLLVCVDGLTYREAAEATGTPIGTVMSRLSRARLALMERLGAADLELYDNVHKLNAK
jgi:RNA polymerase sigma-70 factor (ECF subfamily)